jgi:ribosome production factor 2
MILNGTKTSSVIKGVVADLHHMKKTGGNSIKFSRKNDNVRPFEGGGETSLEFLSQKTDCSLFVVSQDAWMISN